MSVPIAAPPIRPLQPTRVTATELQQKSGQILKRAAMHQEQFVVERDGYPVVAIIPIDQFKGMQARLFNPEVDSPNPPRAERV